MVNSLLSLKRFLGYIQSRLAYKQKIASLTDIKLADIDKVYREVYGTEFMKEIITKSNIRRGFFDFSAFSVLRAPTLYVLCRISKPEVVIETGVADGFSSAFILRALEKNQKGHLYSIDLPNQPGQGLGNNKQTGWLVPEEFKHRWSLIFGSSQNKLPALLQDLGKIDIFFHDSDHSYQNMMFEFNQAWRYLKPRGYLLSDDITENDAFADFVRFKGAKFFLQLFKLGMVIR